MTYCMTSWRCSVITIIHCDANAVLCCLQLDSTPKEWRMASAASAARPKPPPVNKPPTPAQPTQPQAQQQRSHHLTQLAQQQGMLPPAQQPTPAVMEQPGDFDDHMMGMSPENVFMPPRTAGQQFGRLNSGMPMNAMRAQPSWTSSPMIIHGSAM